jgi:hypothetical protein
MGTPLRKVATPPNEAELVIEVEGADELSAQIEELAQRLRDLDWAGLDVVDGEEEKLLVVEDGTLEVDEKKAAAIRAVLDQEAQSASRWADLIWLGADDDEPFSIDVDHVPSTSWPTPVKVIGASVSDSLTQPYDPAEHKTLEDIQAEADVMAQGIPMALFGGECRWWTTDINACYMDPLTESGCGCKRPCCPHCGKPLVMVPLGDFLDKANKYAHTFGDTGLRALELAHAHNLGRLLCLNDWDLYVDVANVNASLVPVWEDSNYAD